MTATLIDPQLVQRLTEQGDTPIELFPAGDTKTCEVCQETYVRDPKRPRGEFAKRRFCSRPCALKGQARPGKVKLAACKRGHPFDDANTAVDSRGRRRCRECSRIWDAARVTTRAGRVEQVRAKARPKPAPVRPIPAAPPREPAPVWRPAGWAPVEDHLARAVPR